jgi:hypothetical protein
MYIERKEKEELVISNPSSSADSNIRAVIMGTIIY